MMSASNLAGNSVWARLDRALYLRTSTMFVGGTLINYRLYCWCVRAQQASTGVESGSSVEPVTAYAAAMRRCSAR